MDGVAPTRLVGVSAAVYLPLHHKVQKFSSGTGSPGLSQKKGCNTVVMWMWWYSALKSYDTVAVLASFKTV